MNPKRIVVFDPGLDDNSGGQEGNLGDQIISEAIALHLAKRSPQAAITRISSHVFPGPLELDLLAQADLVVVGGSNLLSSDYEKNRQWAISLKQYGFRPRPVLMGVGWQKYQHKPSFFTSLFCRLMLHSRALHSVRDSYTQSQLFHCGLRNVVNTSCPTLWLLEPKLLAGLPCQLSAGVVFTLTEYCQDAEADRKMIGMLRANYQKLYFWPQGPGDCAYLQSLSADLSGMVVLPRRLKDFDSLLASSESLDYVGTRLHGGIRALQHRRRALIIQIDNRAREISADTNLPVLPREQISELDQLLKSPAPILLQIDKAASEKFLSSLPI